LARIADSQLETFAGSYLETFAGSHLETFAGSTGIWKQILLF